MTVHSTFAFVRVGRSPKVLYSGCDDTVYRDAHQFYNAFEYTGTEPEYGPEDNELEGTGGSTHSVQAEKVYDDTVASLTGSLTDNGHCAVNYRSLMTCKGTPSACDRSHVHATGEPRLSGALLLEGVPACVPQLARPKFSRA